jgi:hypothetical protein
MIFNSRHFSAFSIFISYLVLFSLDGTSRIIVTVSAQAGFRRLFAFNGQGCDILLKLNQCRTYGSLMQFCDSGG